MSLKIYYWNCASGLLRKIDYIRELIKQDNVDLFFVAESEIRYDCDFGCLTLTGYDIVAANTINSRGKARLICFKKQGFSKVEGLNEFNDALIFQLGNVSVAGIYRGFKLFEGESESSNFLRLIGDLNKLDPNRELVVVGDFNLDQNKKEGILHRELNDWVLEKGLSILKLGITRARLVTGTLQESELDLVITNTIKLKVDREFNAMSDHCVVKTCLPKFKSVDKIRKEIEFVDCNFDVAKANEFLKQSLQSKPIMFEKVEESNYQIMASLQDTLSKFVRRRTLVIRNADQVISPLIQKLKNRKNRLQKVWLKERNAISWVNFIRSSRELKKEVRKVRNNQIKNRLGKGSKEFWAQVNQLMGKENLILDKIVENGNEISDKTVISNSFINFFTSKINRILGDYEPSEIPRLPGEITLFNQKDIDKAFQRLSNKKSVGMDNLSGFFLKLLKPTLLPYFEKLFNLILVDNSVPTTWKIARITPVFKKGCKTNVGDYRPVSNLNSISKLFELCILERFEALDFDNLMGKFQHGFRKGHNTETAILDLMENITTEVELKKFVCVYSADLTAAFDLLRKEALIVQLIKKGVPNYLINTISEYITDRFGYVQVEASRSIVKRIRAGCIQGSIIGPLLFNIYTNQLQEIIYPNKACAYADDAYVVVSAESETELKEKLENTLKMHFDWLKSVGMECNLAKTELITFFDGEIEITIDNANVKSKENIKALGLTLDKKLSWTEHVERVIKKCRGLMYGLRYVRNNVELEVMKSVIRAQVISRISYGAAVWSHRLSYIMKTRLKSAYYKILRVVLRDFDFKHNCAALLLMTGQEDIISILFKRTSVALFRMVSTILPTELSTTILSKSYYNERTPGHLSFFDTSRTKFGRACISNVAGKIAHEWKFDWLHLSQCQFKQHLSKQCTVPRI